MKTLRVLIPLPSRDFDPTEAAIPYKILSENKIEVVFATPQGLPAHCDDRMRTGRGLFIFSSILKANLEAQAAYIEMSQCYNFLNPFKWSELRSADYDAIILPGGHAKGMKEYLESEILQKLIASFFDSKKLIGAICHGVVLAARSHDLNGVSVLKGRKTTALLASQELFAWALTYLWLGDYYRTYQPTIESEVKSFLSNPKDFLKGPLPLLKDSASNLKPGFFVQDQNYISARWPGDAHAFSHQILKMLRIELPNSL